MVYTGSEGDYYVRTVRPVYNVLYTFMVLGSFGTSVGSRGVPKTLGETPFYNEITAIAVV